MDLLSFVFRATTNKINFIVPLAHSMLKVGKFRRLEFLVGLFSGESQALLGLHHHFWIEGI